MSKTYRRITQGQAQRLWDSKCPIYFYPKDAGHPIEHSTACPVRSTGRITFNAYVKSYEENLGTASFYVRVPRGVK